MKPPLIPVDEGARLVLERKARLAVLDASIARGVADANAGRVKPASEVFDAVESGLRTAKHSPPNQKG